MKCNHPDIVVDLSVNRFIVKPGTKAVGVESSIINLLPTGKIKCDGCDQMVVTHATGRFNAHRKVKLFDEA